MTIRIEVLSRSNSKITSAMYYETPADIYSPDAATAAEAALEALAS